MSIRQKVIWILFFSAAAYIYVAAIQYMWPTFASSVLHLPMGYGTQYLGALLVFVVAAVLASMVGRGSA